MAQPSYPAADEPRQRPTTVTVSSYLIWLTAAISVISSIIALSTIGTAMDVYRTAYEGTDAEGGEALVVGVTVVTVVIGLLFAAALAILAVFNNRGRNGARITTWVLGAISLCCTGAGLASTAMTNSMNIDSGTGPDPRELERQLNEALPSWYNAANVTLTVISLLATLAAIILLALPASNAFFRAPQAAWDPSMPYPYPGQQPGYPNQPPYPGQAGQPGQPPYPGQPGQPGEPPYPGQPGQAPDPASPGQQPPSTPPAPPAGNPPPADKPADQPPAGSDPWSAPPADDRKPPSDPPAPA